MSYSTSPLSDRPLAALGDVLALEPPKRCCPVWPCDYIVVNIPASATYDCDPGAPTPFPASGDWICKIVIDDDDYHTWEYDDGTLRIFIECDRREERKAEGFGPCPEVTIEYDDGGSVQTCFGPIKADIRSCTCLTTEEDDDYVGYIWGEAYLSGSLINSDPSNNCACHFDMPSGDTISIKCLCAGTCNCVGFKKELSMVWDCPGGLGTVSLDLDFYDYDSLPAGATTGLLSSPRGVWYGEVALSETCSLEVQLFCNPFGFAIPFLLLHHDSPDDPCVAAELACNCRPTTTCIISSQCRDPDADPPVEMELVFGCCPSTTCPCETPVSTITITERV